MTIKHNLPSNVKIPFEELFDEEFMFENTKCSSISEFFKNGGFEIRNEEDFKNVDDTQLDNYTLENTDFENWKEMYIAATKKYIKKTKLFTDK
jgi:hypothetical protein